ncbi:HipA family kinase [Luteimonas deserti]|uniref:HipA family kinase n=1 Tax=Luteimonas deserti TaxID=2752306 RepID=UPI002E297CA0|nr:HipA family kinase [Luteimonas deserti]
MRAVEATRYVTPLREGGSLPAVVEADDDGMYVMKFRGAGQGAKALVAELVGGEFARLLGLPIPEIVFIDLDPDMAATEPDPEIQHLIRASAGCNLALDYLPGAINFDPAVDAPNAELASRIVWLDAFICNVDRTPRNTNLLVWHRRLTLIDHGAALYFHHDWDSAARVAVSPFGRIGDHVLLPFASALVEADTALSARVGEDDIRRIVDTVPDAWLPAEAGLPDPAAHRRAYVEFFCQRLAHRAVFVEEAQRAHAGRL